MPTELLFTYPSVECPHPERWTADTRGATENEVSELIAAFVRALQPNLVVETGTLLGNTAVAIGYALLRNNEHGRLFTLDIQENYVAACQARVKGLPVTCVHQSSLDWEPPGPVDLLFSDSELDLRASEIRHYRKWMHDRSVVIVHDTAKHHEYPLWRDLDALVVDRVLGSVTYLPTPRGIAICRVNQP